MNDQLGDQIPSPDQKPSVEPIGTVILGNVDPRTLDKEQFRESPDLLFHGAGEDFVFSRSFDYLHRSADEGFSSTLGRGFYATERKEEAEFFSEARHGEQITVLEVLPYQAKMLDLRARIDPRKNADVPQELFEKYLDFVIQEFETKAEGKTYEDFIKTHPDQWVLALYIFKESPTYINTLKKMRETHKPIELRSMLSMSGDPARSEFATEIFPRFMRQEGFDGVIYNEGGDIVSKQKNPTSFVFFNLDKIGDFEAWHQVPKTLTGEKRVKPDNSALWDFFKKN